MLIKQTVMINKPIYKFSFSQILKQPLAIVYLIIFLIIMILTFFLEFKVFNSKIIELKILNISVDEPYIISSLISSFSGLILWIICFIIILITNKFWGDFLKNPLLDIFIAKLNNKKVLVDSSLIAAFILLIIPIFILFIFYSMLFYLKFYLIINIYLINIFCYYSLAILYILSFSFYLVQIFDEFFSSLALILLLFISGYVSSFVEDTSLINNLFNILFPLSSLNYLLVNNISGNYLFEPYIFLALITSICFYWLGIKKFQKGNN